MTKLKQLMMAGIAVSGLAFTTGISTIDANAQAQHYRGGACIIAVNAACAPKGWSVGDCAKARFTPPNVLGNGDRTSFSMVWTNYAQNFRANESLIGPTYKPVQFSYVGGGGGVAGQARTTMRVLLVQPANYATQWMHAVIDVYRVDDFFPDDPSACGARYRFTGVKYPDQVPASTPADAFGNDSLGFDID